MKYSLTMGSGRSRIRLLYGSQIRKAGSAKNTRFFLFFFLFVENQELLLECKRTGSVLKL